ncbi:MAG TPA: hypothetical protein V6D17_23505 [Candidatus Obscuribacterales bacterium]
MSADANQSDEKQKEKKPKSGAHKTAAISSAVLWVAGFALAFVIPPRTPFIWVPDFLLLIGFIPLLWVWRPSWPWIVFGVLNVIIGFVLLVAFYLPDGDLPRQEMVTLRRHLAEYHSPYTWMLTGIGATVYGFIRMIKNIVLWVKARKAKNKNA